MSYKEEECGAGCEKTAAEHVLERKQREDAAKPYVMCRSVFIEQYSHERSECHLQRGHDDKHRGYRGTTWTTKELRIARVKIASENMAKAFTELFSAMLPEDDE